MTELSCRVLLYRTIEIPHRRLFNLLLHTFLHKLSDLVLRSLGCVGTLISDITLYKRLSVSILRHCQLEVTSISIIHVFVRNLCDENETHNARKLSVIQTITISNEF